MTREELVQRLRTIPSAPSTLPLRPPAVAPTLVERGFPVDDARLAVALPTGVAAFQVDGVRVILFTKRLVRRDHFCIVVVVFVTGAHWLIVDAFHLHGGEQSVLATDPVEAFAETLVRYGVDYRVEGRHGRFVPMMRIPTAQADVAGRPILFEALGLDQTRPYASPVLMKDTGTHLLVPWLYVIDLDRYQSDVREAMRSRVQPTPRSPAGLVVQQSTPFAFVHRLRSLLEDMFSRDWLAGGRADHPARRQWQSCQTLLMRGGGGVNYPDDRELLLSASQTLMDALTLASIRSADPGDLVLGDLKGYGDRSVQDKIASRKHDAPQWEDLMVGLYIASWYLGDGYDVVPLPEAGLPDLRVNHQSGVPTFIECKRLRTHSADRVAAVIKEANAQIKLAAEGEDNYSSCVVLDVSGLVGEHAGDEVPDAATAVIRATHAALRGRKNRSVRLALVVWDYHYEAGGVPPRGTFFVRRPEVVRHASATRTVEAPIPLFSGTTTMVLIDWEPGHGQ